jgi:serine/threonine-protein kinase
MATELPKPGDKVGKYSIIRVLGQGGMGCVFEAVHGKLEQRVAIKVLRPESATDQDDVLRFEREARLASQLRTRHAVRIFDVDVTPSGLPYMVMELVDGRDVSEEVRSRDVPTGEVVAWMVQICEALSEAHAAGIVHRDIKTSNILVVRERSHTVAKLVDFGIAKDLDATALTVTGAWVGTPAYMAPEQFERGAKVDARTDIWAVGVTIYRVVSGRYPFEGGDCPSIVEAINTRTAVPLFELAPTVPRALSDVVMRAIAKAPAERYPSADALAAALAPFADTKPVVAPMAGKLPSASAETVRESEGRSSDVTETAAPTPEQAAPTPAAPPPTPRRSTLGLAGLGLALVALLAWRALHRDETPPKLLDALVPSVSASAPASASVSSPAFSPASAPASSPAPASAPASALAPASAHPAARATERACFCEAPLLSANSLNRMMKLCATSKTPRCNCKEGEHQLCATPWTYDATTNSVHCADEWGFGTAGKRTGDACNGYSFEWEGNVLKPTRHDGISTLCDTCYEPIAPQAAVPGTLCRGIMTNGKTRDGTWRCESE